MQPRLVHGTSVQTLGWFCTMLEIHVDSALFLSERWISALALLKETGKLDSKRKFVSSQASTF